MRQPVLALLLLLWALALPASAQDRAALGVGTIFNNDAIGDGQDRWRTASFAVSALYGPRATVGADRPAGLGELVEFRYRTEIVTAANSVAPVPGDRRYAGIVSLGAHTHAAREGVELSLGGDLVLTGPMTRVGLLQRQVHGWFGMALPDITNQLPDGVFPTATVEAARPFRIGGALQLRPFVEASAGVESFVRVGGDLTIGQVLGGDQLVRDTVTGQFYRAGRDVPRPGFALVLGADVAKVFDSYLLPGDDGFVLTDQRSRLRAGLHWQGERAAVFYGISWLSEEFVAQPEGQAVGSMQLSLRF